MGWRGRLSGPGPGPGPGGRARGERGCGVGARVSRVGGCGLRGLFWGIPCGGVWRVRGGGGGGAAVSRVPCASGSGLGAGAGSWGARLPPTFLPVWLMGEMGVGRVLGPLVTFTVTLCRGLGHCGAACGRDCSGCWLPVPGWFPLAWPMPSLPVPFCDLPAVLVAVGLVHVEVPLP